MPGVVCIKKTRRLIHVNFFLQCTMEKSILFIELADGPTIGESKCKYNPMVVEKKRVVYDQLIQFFLSSIWDVP